MNILEDMGYYNKEYLLNAKDFGIPQNRRRVVIVSTLEKIDLIDFHSELSPNVSMYLKRDGDFKIFNDKYRLTMSVYKTNELLIRNGTKQGFIRAKVGEIVDMAFPKSKTRRARLIKDRSCPTILTSAVLGVVTEDLNLRYLTAEEAWLFSGRTLEDYKKAYEALLDSDLKGIESKLYELSGNTVVPQVVAAVAEQLKDYLSQNKIGKKVAKWKH